MLTLILGNLITTVTKWLLPRFGLRAELFANIAVKGGLIVAVIVILLVAGWWLNSCRQRRLEDKSRQAVAEKITEGIRHRKTAEQIEKEIDNLLIQEGADQGQIEKAREAVEKAKEKPSRAVTKEDILKSLEELGL